MAQPFDLTKRELAGAPFLVSQRLLIAFASGLPRAAVSASQNGVLAYRTRIDTGSTELVWFDRAGKRLESAGESADYSNPALSPDERRLVVSRMDPQARTRDLWLLDVSNRVLSRFTFDPADETNAVWSPDGSRIAYNAVRNGVIDIYEKEGRGGLGTQTSAALQRKQVYSRLVPRWKVPAIQNRPDDVGLAWNRRQTGRALRDGKPADLAQRPMGCVHVKPVREVGGLRPEFSPGGREWQISTAGGTEPSWRADGKELFYISADKLVAMQVKTDSPVFEPGIAKPLFAVHLETTGRRSRYQSASNGRRFLVNLPVESSSPITIAINWTRSQGR